MLGHRPAIQARGCLNSWPCPGIHVSSYTSSLPFLFVSRFLLVLQVAQAREDAEGDEGAPIKCSIKLQKEGPDSKLYDEVCGDNTADDHAGLCE